LWFKLLLLLPDFFKKILMSVPKILSIDDSRMVHMFIGRGFAPYDVDLVFASNGQEGLDAARKEKPSLILLLCQ